MLKELQKLVARGIYDYVKKQLPELKDAIKRAGVKKGYIPESVLAEMDKRFRDALDISWPDGYTEWNEGKQGLVELKFATKAPVVDRINKGADWSAAARHTNKGGELVAQVGEDVFDKLVAMAVNPAFDYLAQHYLGEPQAHQGGHWMILTKVLKAPVLEKGQATGKESEFFYFMRFNASEMANAKARLRLAKRLYKREPSRGPVLD